MAVAGLILAGGQATRMGGGDKPLRLLCGKPMLTHVIERFAPQCSLLLLNANGDPNRFSAFNLPVIKDELSGFQGPLAGILSGLDYLAQYATAIESMVSIAGDTPFLPHDYVMRLTQSGGVSCAYSDGFAHPVNALWRVDMRHALREFLERGERKIDIFTKAYAPQHVVWTPIPFDPFFNANSLSELEEAEKIYIKHIV